MDLKKIGMAMIPVVVALIVYDKFIKGNLPF